MATWPGVRGQHYPLVQQLVYRRVHLARMAIMLVVAADAAKNRDLQRVECIGLYWHFVDIIWIFLFPLLYIAR